MSATERCFLNTEAFNVSHRLLWIPGLLEVIFEEGAIPIS